MYFKVFSTIKINVCLTKVILSQGYYIDDMLPGNGVFVKDTVYGVDRIN